MTLLVSTAAALYLLAMGLVFGGTAALSFAAAPQVFRALRPVDAGRAFGRVLWAFDRMTLVASGVAVAAAVTSLLPGVTAAGVVCVVLAALVHAVGRVLRGSVAPRMAALKPPETEDEDRRWDPDARRAFDQLHRQYVRLYAANLFLAAAAVAIEAMRR